MILKLSKPISQALDELGFNELTEVQEKSIPFALKGEDLIVQSRTGTGKTAAFAIPIYENVSPDKHVQAIVLVPTRELAGQVATDFKKIGKFSHINSVVVYGGVSLDQQVNRIRAGAQIVIGTPGRVLDLINRHALDLSKVKFFVLDEADLMLAMGFIRDVEKIMAASSKKKQIMLFCVDFPQEIMDLAKKHMRYPQHVKLVTDDKSAQGVTQNFYLVNSGRKLSALMFILNEAKPTKAIIFCKTKRRVKELTRTLNHNGVKCEGIHGDLTQAQRNRIMDSFKENKVNILLATDVASRGIHINKVSHVINFELPHDINYYIHRIGRTGRMHEVGEAITLCYSDELSTLGQIERLMGKRLDEKFLPDNLPFVQVPQREFSSGGRGNFSHNRFGSNNSSGRNARRPYGNRDSNRSNSRPDSRRRGYGGQY
ncbi:MAG: DEAD/DEAH box helicase [archaeon]|nr:DEAD/DEAH box helicase [archaeon]